MFYNMFLFIPSTESVNSFYCKRKRLIIAIWWSSKREAKKRPHLASWDIPPPCPFFFPILKADTMLCLRRVKKVKCFHSEGKKNNKIPDAELRVASRGCDLPEKSLSALIKGKQAPGMTRAASLCSLLWRLLIELQSSIFFCD